MLTNSQIADYERRLELDDSRRYDKDDEGDEMGLASAVKVQINIMRVMLSQRHRLGENDLQAEWLAVCVESAIENLEEHLMDDKSGNKYLRTAVEGQINYMACTLAYVFDDEQEVSKNPDQQVGALAHSIKAVISALEYSLDEAG